MDQLLKQLQEMITSKDKKIAELEKAVAEGGGVHHHYHYHYERAHWGFQPYWTTTSFQSGNTGSLAQNSSNQVTLQQAGCAL